MHPLSTKTYTLIKPWAQSLYFGGVRFFKKLQQTAQTQLQINNTKYQLPQQEVVQYLFWVYSISWLFKENHPNLACGVGDQNDPAGWHVLLHSSPEGMLGVLGQLVHLSQDHHLELLLTFLVELVWSSNCFEKTLYHHPFKKSFNICPISKNV